MIFSIWFLIIILSCIVFFNRYIFLDPNLGIKIPVFLSRVLKYSAPCLLASICAPIIFLRNEAFDYSISNSYLLGAIITILLSLLIKRLVVVVIFSLCVFYTLVYFL
jgi:branched-subunit amino acid transport protein